MTVPVPSVAMKLSMRATSTRRPLSTPVSAPSASTTSTATGQGRPNMVCRLIARICQSTMPYPIVRSMRPQAIGIIAASDRIAMIVLLAMIERRFRRVGNVSGSRIEKRTISRTVRITSP